MEKSKRNKFFWEWVLMIVALGIFIFSFFLSQWFTGRVSLEARAKKIESYIKKQKADFQNVLQDKILMGRLIESKETLDDVQDFYNKPYGFYLYNESGNHQFLQFWNTYEVLPDNNIIYAPDGETFVKLTNGYYYIIKQHLPDHPGISAFCLILVKYSFYVETSRLANTFPVNSTLHNTVDVSLSPTPYPVIMDNGKPSFYLKKIAGTKLPTDSTLSIVLRILGLFLIFVALYLILHKLYVRQNYMLDIYIFIGCFAVFRLILAVSRSVFNLSDFELFDPSVFGTSYFLPTLGDLLINSLLFCLITVFVWNRLSAIKQYKFEQFSQRSKWAIAFCLITGVVVATFIITKVIRSIILDSKISFDVANLSSLNIYIVVGFLILACLCLGFYYFTRIAFKYIFLVFPKNSFIVYLLLLIACMAFILIFANNDLVSFYFPCSVWLLLYTFLFHKEEKINRFVKFSVSGIVFWIFLFSGSLAILMMSEIKKAELIERKTYVERLATQTDPASERLINIANKYLDNRFFRDNFNRLVDVKQNKIIRDSIVSKNYIGYLNKYETTLYVFDSLGNSLSNPDNLSLASLNTIINRQSRPTSVPDLFYYETAFDKFAYIDHRIITDSAGNLLGTAFIISNPKKFSGASIHPELFKEFNKWDIANSSIYQFAIYNNNALVNSSKKYPFTTSLVQSQIPKYRFELRQRDGYSELWYRATSDKVVVMARRSQTFIEAITLFSYLFCSFLFLLAIIQAASMLITTLTNVRGWRQRILFFPTIRGQIHGTFILITVLSFLVVAIATISFFIVRYEDNNKERLSRTMNIMLNELQTHEELLNTIYDLSGKPDTGNIASLDSLVKLVSDIHGVDVNLYDLTGKLRSTSQQDVYSKGVLSTQMGSRAYYNLLRLRRIEHIQKEQVSNLNFTSIYSPIRDKAGKLYGYVGIPYFTSQEELNQEISNFLVTIINLNAFIFLITGLVALLIANRITRSFSIISDKMKMISLSKSNEEIKWNRKDEIGALVREYNKMVRKLEESANTMARDEREGAWREMARQVAHEIKNPLTPMRLSLQYLQKAINEDSPHVHKLAANVSNNLVEQIDHLSKIAADFSQFANINQTDKQIFDLHEVLYPLKELFSKNQKVNFQWNALPNEVNILGDKTQMNRLFTNLLANAIDATETKEQSFVSIKEKLQDDTIVLSVSDNGSGIEDSMISKIFTPNFTTKTSGTGLGLAMCKGIVEKTGGKIWFTTQVDVGTTFYVQLPLVQS